MRDSYYYKRRVVELGQERATLKIIQVDLTLDEEPALLVHDLQEYSGRDPRQKGQLVVVGADVVVPIVSHCTLHWPHTHHMYEFAREPTQIPRLTNGGARKPCSAITTPAYSPAIARY
jgi:hypothetical protein